MKLLTFFFYFISFREKDIFRESFPVSGGNTGLPAGAWRIAQGEKRSGAQ
jgi:hypothetical protein